MLPPKELAQLMESLDAMPNDPENKTVLKRIIGSESVQVTLDKAGRICVPEEMVRAAGIEKEAVLVGLLDDLTLKDVETRLANWLVKRCPNPDGTAPVRIVLPMAKRVLAAELGTVSETFSRTLAQFREQGLVSVTGKTLVVLSPARLAALLRQHLGE